MRIGAAIDEDFDHVHFALEHGTRQRRLAAVVRLVWVRAALQQGADRFCVAVIRGEHHQAVTTLICQTSADAGIDVGREAGGGPCASQGKQTGRQFDHIGFRLRVHMLILSAIQTSRFSAKNVAIGLALKFSIAT